MLQLQLENQQQLEQQPEHEHQTTVNHAIAKRKLQPNVNADWLR